MHSEALALVSRYFNEDRYAAVVSIAQQAGAASSRRNYSPIDGALIAEVAMATPAQMQDAIAAAHQSFLNWRLLPAPKRGDFVRVLGNLFRRHKSVLAHIITLEMGKTLRESLGEVQEVIDICDFAVGLSRQLYGLTMATERPRHRMMEQWHPLGVVGVISAFNFPMAVWAWNATLAWVCGDTVVWKPSEKTPLSALACQHLVEEAVRQCGWGALYPALSVVVNGDATVGHAMAGHRLTALVSATGSCRMGRQVAVTVAERLGRALLELGGNNAIIVAPSADTDLALKAVAFSALGTSGQRCTSLRRLFLHESIADAFLARLVAAYRSVEVGDPFDDNTLCGPLIDLSAVQHMQEALRAAIEQGGRCLTGGELYDNGVAGGHYVRPAIVEIDLQAPIVQEETFAPLLYVGRYSALDLAIEQHNAVRQGLSSSLFSNDMREVEQFLSAAGSDCGVANINIGTSGAEIGGAFGGDKETGGGRESGSDAWKAYMRRATNTINYGNDVPLAQGIVFSIP